MYRAEALAYSACLKSTTEVRHLESQCTGDPTEGVSILRDEQEGGASILVLHGEFRVDDALDGQLLVLVRHRDRHYEQHPDHLLHRDGDPDEVGRQDQGAQDQQPGLVLRQPTQELEPCGGGDGSKFT
jgi:hypothetical protein